MEIEYQLSKSDYIKFHKIYIRDFILKRPAVLILLIVIFIFPLTGDKEELWRLLCAFVASPLIVLGLLYFIPLSISVVRLNKALSKDKSGLEKKKLTITDEWLLIESESKRIIRAWESIVSANSNEKFIYLILADKRILLFPKVAFSSEIEAINFLGAIQARIVQIRGITPFTNYKEKQKPDYWRGLICLIPLIGAFAGLIFIIYGIFKYKDKWLIIIGIAGIVWTVAVYGSMDYQLKYSFETRKGFAVISQMQLNSLLKNIEFYKIQHGNYPDSLEQITKDDKMAAINDPLRSFDKDIKKDTKYKYQRIGNHYYLFSLGIDGIPNTRDDIYPQVAKSDSAKFGLIRKSY